MQGVSPPRRCVPSLVSASETRPLSMARPGLSEFDPIAGALVWPIPLTIAAPRGTLTLVTKSSIQFHEDLSREHERRLSSDRTFGLVLGVAFMIVGVFPVLHGNPPRLWAIIIGAVLWILAVAIPGVLHRANVYWSEFGLLLNRIVSPVVMGLLFFAVVTPIALLFRGLGNDPLRRKRDPAAASYWIDRVPPGPSPESIKDQF